MVVAVLEAGPMLWWLAIGGLLSVDALGVFHWNGPCIGYV